MIGMLYPEISPFRIRTDLPEVMLLNVWITPIAIDQDPGEYGTSFSGPAPMVPGIRKKVRACDVNKTLFPQSLTPLASLSCFKARQALLDVIRPHPDSLLDPRSPKSARQCRCRRTQDRRSRWSFLAAEVVRWRPTVPGGSFGCRETVTDGVGRYLVKALSDPWENGVLAIEGGECLWQNATMRGIESDLILTCTSVGSGLGALSNLLERQPATSMFPTMSFPETHNTPVLRAAHVFSLLS